MVCARVDDTSVTTMSSARRGDPADIAMIVPVPKVPDRGKVATEPSAMVRIWTATLRIDGAKAQGMTIERAFSVGSIDFVILSVGLAELLRCDGQKLSEGAAGVLAGHIRGT